MLQSNYALNVYAKLRSLVAVRFVYTSYVYMHILIFALSLLGCYLIGSLSISYLAGRINGVDLREHGSGNLGATNAGRVLGKKWFFIVFFADVCKGFIPVLLIKLYAAEIYDWSEAVLLLHLLPLCSAMSAVLGHNFTIYHKFKGGKAVATSLGVLIALAPLVAGLSFLTWLIVWLFVAFALKLKKSDAVGPASMLASSVCPILQIYLNPEPFTMPELGTSILCIAIAVLILFRHRSNAQKFIAALKNKSSAAETEADAES